MTFAPTGPEDRRPTIIDVERSIEASTTLRAAFARVRDVLLDDPGPVLCETCSPDDRRARRFRTQLGAPLRGGTSLRQEVELHLGAPRSVDGGGIALPMTWRATGHDRLFPTFEGELEASPDRSGTLLRLHGTYTVPLGALGRFGDGVAGRQLARRSLSALVSDLARRLDTQIDRLLKVVPGDLSPHRVAVNERVGPENYVG